jgi:hypothetical protein
VNGSTDSGSGDAQDLQREVEKRKMWFYECQLRGLNLDTFRGAMEKPPPDPDPDPFPDRLIDLVSEQLQGQVGGTLRNLGLVYLDSQEPIWTADERTRREKFAEGFIGRHDNWLGYRSGKRIADRIRDLKGQYEESPFASLLDLSADLVRFGRRHPGRDFGSMGRALSRAMLAEAKPWLIPELYNGKNHDSRPIDKWIENLEAFISNFESDLGLAVGGSPGQALPSDPLAGAAYREAIRSLLLTSLTHNTGDALKVRMLTDVKSADGKSSKYQYDLQVETAGSPMAPVAQYSLCESVRYWAEVVRHPLGEVYVNKANADMGLCMVMRIVYMLGTLPATLGNDSELKWRKRKPPGDEFSAFFKKRSEDPGLRDNEKLQKRFQAGQAKLQIILEEVAALPRSAAATFSTLSQEVIRQALHAFKFWMDEPLRVSSNDKLLRARADTGIVTNDHEKKAEMEYWSENHYIMFASSEHLAGQLWEGDEFQPGKEFLEAGSKTGVITGKSRKERGRARVLKWLNNRLMFGWMEFHSSGYYREHLWAILNLADFSLDPEIREKAALVVDLMLFDVARFLHKGAMGSAGGRSQFKSKSSGWDNALCDVVEILFGSRGMFGDADSEIGASIASSAYRVPDVLLEIGTHPPTTAFTDRSRVSITFDEAPKYGISYSRESDEKDSIMEGFAPKRARYSPFLASVNDEIARTHTDYGATDDDTVFWWGMSAYYNKQIVRGTFAAAKKFNLEESPIFGGAVPTIIRLFSAYEKVKHGVIGGLIGSLAGPSGAVIGAAAGFFEDDVFNVSTLEAASDDLSVLLEGSTRSRANILSFRTPDIMLSSIQNFRAGQVNFQSSVCQVSLHSGLNVFTTAGLEDIDISDLVAGLGGGLLGLAVGAALTVVTGGAGVLLAGGAVLGAAGGVIANEAAAKHEDLGFVDPGDGPGWWTGSWALPMIVQHDSTAILAYDFHTIQDLLAETGSHAWFPKAAFDRVDEMRTSAYDDANFPLWDFTDIGPKGFWLFGKLVHPPEGEAESREAYLGLFSNQRPEWLDQGSDNYERLIEKSVRKPIEDKQEEIDDFLDGIEDNPIGGSKARDAIKAAVDRIVDAVYLPNMSEENWQAAAAAALAKVSDLNASNYPVLVLQDYPNDLAKLVISLKKLQRVWPDPLPRDYFAEREWYVEGKNVWILQVGTREEFGDFQNFKDRVSSARIHLDDTGDLECTYDIPRGDGSSERLRLAAGDAEFELNGSPFQTDLYPRFENPFLRSGRVEWGQREYVIEYRGKSLLHDFSDFTKPARIENFTADAQDRNTIRALVIFLTTRDEEMDESTVATATVRIGCNTMTTDQVIAAGPVEEESSHDAEWIFFDSVGERDVDMSLALTHPAGSDGDDTPRWTMSFTLKALMGDRTLRECSLSFSGFEFEDERRATGLLPFSILLSEWRAWQRIPDGKPAAFLIFAHQPDFTQYYYEYSDLVVVDAQRRLWHRRLRSCSAADQGWLSIASGGPGQPGLAGWFAASAVSPQPDRLILLVQSNGALFASWRSTSGDWNAGWTPLPVSIFPDIFPGIPNTSAPQVPVALGSLSPVAGVPSALSADGVEIFVLGADGNFYAHPDWRPLDMNPWRKIDVSGFTPLVGEEFLLVGDFLFVLSLDRALWTAPVVHATTTRFPSWERLTAPGVMVLNFTATFENSVCQVVVTTAGKVTAAASYSVGKEPAWLTINLPEAGVSSIGPLASAVPFADKADFFSLGTDGKVYTIRWEAAKGWTASQQWVPVEPATQSFIPLVTTRIAATSRVKGQVELFVQGADHELHKAWWS